MYRKYFLTLLLGCLLIFSTCSSRAEMSYSNNTRVKITIKKKIQPFEQISDRKKHSLLTINEGKKSIRLSNMGAQSYINMIGILLLILGLCIYLIRFIQKKRRKKDV